MIVCTPSCTAAASFDPASAPTMRKFVIAETEPVTFAPAFFSIPSTTARGFESVPVTTTVLPLRLASPDAATSFLRAATFDFAAFVGFFSVFFGFAFGLPMIPKRSFSE